MNMGARRWIFGGLLVVAVVVVTVVVGFNRAAEQIEQAKLKAALDRAESLGMAVYAEQLRENPIPDKDNAFVEYSAIQNMVVAEDWGQTGKILPRHLFDFEDPVGRDLTARQMVSDWQSALELARAGARKPSFDAQREWEQGPMVLPQDFHRMDEVCRVLIEEAKILFDDGELAGSCGSLRTILAIIGHYKSEGMDLNVSMMSTQEVAVAKEIVRQAQMTTSKGHLQELGEMLADMFEPVTPKDLVRNQIVEYVEFIRLVSEDNEYGDTFREQMKEMQITNAVAEAFGTTLPADEARGFEIRAIYAACDFYESTSDAIEDYEHNEELFLDMLREPFSWALDGLPLGFMRPYEVYNGLDVETAIYVYKRHARHVVFGDMYRSLFDHVTGKKTLADGESWKAPSLNLAVLTFAKSEDGFEVTIDMPGFDPRSYQFANPN